MQGQLWAGMPSLQGMWCPNWWCAAAAAVDGCLGLRRPPHLHCQPHGAATAPDWHNLTPKLGLLSPKSCCPVSREGPEDGLVPRPLPGACHNSMCRTRWKCGGAVVYPSSPCCRQCCSRC
eukprot:scaffold34540_cov17-Tisochrysis_lutea.AAC.1